jgi:aspartate aminotransferase
LTPVAARILTWLPEITGFGKMYEDDNHPKKVNLVIGAYRDDMGKPYVLQSIKEAEESLIGMNKE